MHCPDLVLAIWELLDQEGVHMIHLDTWRYHESISLQLMEHIPSLLYRTQFLKFLANRLINVILCFSRWFFLQCAFRVGFSCKLPQKYLTLNYLVLFWWLTFHVIWLICIYLMRRRLNKINYVCQLSHIDFVALGPWVCSFLCISRYI